jgi:hypothetical protein
MIVNLFLFWYSIYNKTKHLKIFRLKEKNSCNLGSFVGLFQIFDDKSSLKLYQAIGIIN